jgi:hypothetical protein
MGLIIKLITYTVSLAVFTVSLILLTAQYAVMLHFIL